MPDFYPALNVAIEEDLFPLSVLLHQHGVGHRIFEESGCQVVMVERQEQASQVQALYRAWRSGQVQIDLSPREQSAGPVQGAVQWYAAPVTLLLIFLSICGFLLIYLSAPVAWVSYLTFTPFQLRGEEFFFQNFNGQYWRLVTPVFLHFSWLHIAFNCLWLWDLGRRIEQEVGHFSMLMLCLLIAVISNVCQFVFGGPGLFGGMSGVVYGLFGLSWVAPLLQPRWHIRPPKSVILLMLGWLVACLAGVVEGLGFGAVANAAHVGGLLAGAVLGVLLGAFSRTVGDKARAPKL